MSALSPASVEFTGELAVALPIDGAFELFSPLGEKLWVPGWDPELLHPPGASWERGLIFRTREEKGDAVWIVTDLDHAAHRVEYHRVEAGRYLARVRVQCARAAERQTRVTVSYAFVGLSPDGNAEIARMTPGDYVDKMQRWERWIGEHRSYT